MKSKFSKLFLGLFLFLFSFSPTLSEDNGCQDYCMASYSQQEEEAYAWWSGSLDSLYWDAAIFLVGAWSGYLSQSSQVTITFWGLTLPTIDGVRLNPWDAISAIDSHYYQLLNNALRQFNYCLSTC